MRIQQYVRFTFSGLFACCFTSNAYSQLSQVRETSLHQTTVAVEVKPLPTMLTAAPGVGSIGAGVEMMSSNHLSTFLQGYVLNANLPTRLRNEASEDNMPVVQKAQGYSAEIGERYYGNSATLDSWYGGAKVGYALSLSQWGYKSEKIHHSFRSVMPGLEAGYRWIWASGLLTRLGAGVDSNIIQQNTSDSLAEETQVTTDAEDKVTGAAQVAVVPRVDVGVGYAF